MGCEGMMTDEAFLGSTSALIDPSGVRFHEVYVEQSEEPIYNKVPITGQRVIYCAVLTSSIFSVFFVCFLSHGRSFAYSLFYLLSTWTDFFRSHIVRCATGLYQLWSISDELVTFPPLRVLARNRRVQGKLSGSEGVVSDISLFRAPWSPMLLSARSTLTAVGRC